MHSREIVRWQVDRSAAVNASAAFVYICYFERTSSADRAGEDLAEGTHFADGFRGSGR
jgi:hypothetical protein